MAGTLGGARSRLKVRVRCAFGKRGGMKSIREPRVHAQRLSLSSGDALAPRPGDATDRPRRAAQVPGLRIPGSLADVHFTRRAARKKARARGVERRARRRP